MVEAEGIVVKDKSLKEKAMESQLENIKARKENRRARVEHIVMMVVTMEEIKKRSKIQRTTRGGHLPVRRQKNNAERDGDRTGRRNRVYTGLDE